MKAVLWVEWMALPLVERTAARWGEEWAGMLVEKQAAYQEVLWAVEWGGEWEGMMDGNRAAEKGIQWVVWQAVRTVEQLGEEKAEKMASNAVAQKEF